MSKANFTAERVTNFRCPDDKKQILFWDAKTPSLGLRATSGGAKSFVFETRLHGKTLRLTIGDTRTWTVARAQAEATRLKMLTDQGLDPRTEKAQRQADAIAASREAKRSASIVGDAWAEYLETNRAKWSDRHFRDHINLAQLGGKTKLRGKGLTRPGPLAALMSLKLSELSAESIVNWLTIEARERPTGAEQSYRKLRAFIRWCEERPEYAGVVSSTTYAARSVKEAVPRTRAKSDCLQRDQLQLWFAGVRAIHNPAISAYLQGLLITGARREELAALRWEDVDFRWRSLVLNDKIEGTGGRTIPLTPYLAELLEHLRLLGQIPPDRRRQARLHARGESWAPSPWVFASKTSEDGKIAEPRIAHKKVLAAAGLPHITLHGLRRSFGTLSEWVEVPVGVVAQIQGHKPSAIAEKHYRRRPLDLLRMWHDRIEAWLLEQADLIVRKDSQGTSHDEQENAAGID